MVSIFCAHKFIINTYIHVHLPLILTWKQHNSIQLKSMTTAIYVHVLPFCFCCRLFYAYLLASVQWNNLENIYIHNKQS